MTITQQSTYNKIIWGILGTSGRFYVHIPNGRTEVYLDPEYYSAGGKPLETLSYSAWMELKETEGELNITAQQITVNT